MPPIDPDADALSEQFKADVLAKIAARSEQFKADVLAKIEETHADANAADTPDAHLYGAFDFSKIKAVVVSLDAITQKLAPVIASLTPAQYAMYVTTVSTILHTITTNLAADAG